MQPITFAVASGGTTGTSDAPIPDGHRLSSLELPTLTSTTLTISLSTDGTTYNAIYDVAGNAIGVVGGAASTGGKIIEIPDYIGRLTEGKYVRITVAAQGGARTITGVASRLDGSGSANAGGAATVSPLGATTDAKNSATDTTAVTAISLLKQLSAYLAALPLPATSSYSVATTITRPANTTAYTLNDCLGGALDLGVLGPSGENVYITDVNLEYDVAALPAGFSAQLHLYNVTPPSATADNGAWDIPSGDRASYLGYIQLTVPTDMGSTLIGNDSNLNKKVKLSGTHLFGYLVVTAFTPAGNSEVLVLTVHTTRC